MDFNTCGMKLAKVHPRVSKKNYIDFKAVIRRIYALSDKTLIKKEIMLGPIEYTTS
jgi:hypothetical protein